MKLSQRKAAVIRGAAIKVGIGTVLALSKKTKIPYSTLTRKLKDPESLTLRDLENIDRFAKMTDEEILFLVRGRATK